MPKFTVQTCYMLALEVVVAIVGCYFAFTTIDKVAGALRSLDVLFATVGG